MWSHLSEVKVTITTERWKESKLYEVMRYDIPAQYEELEKRPGGMDLMKLWPRLTRDVIQKLNKNICKYVLHVIATAESTWRNVSNAVVFKIL